MELNKLRHTAKGTQVLPTLSVTLPSGTTRDLLVLLDSGAQVNLVRRRLLDPSHLRTSSQPVRLKVANGTPMFGGTEEATRSLQFWQSHSPQVDSSATPTEFSDVFYQADISGYELILGCPFMVNNAMGPWLHRRCLVIESEDDLFCLLRRSQGDVSAVETAPPSMLPEVLPDRPSRWITSSYTITSEHRQTVLQHFGCPTCTVDAFA